MSNSKLNPPSDLDASQLVRLLELELAHKREEWKRTHHRARKTRINAIAFLFLLIFGCAMAFLFLLSSVKENRPMRSQPASSAQSAR